MKVVSWLLLIQATPKASGSTISLQRVPSRLSLQKEAFLRYYKVIQIRRKFCFHAAVSALVSVANQAKGVIRQKLVHGSL
jgi:hypothetical protein